MVTVQLYITNGDSGQTDLLDADFTDLQMELFSQYVTNVERLLSVPYLSKDNTISFSMTLIPGGWTLTDSQLPPRHEVAAMLHYLRPFILKKEPSSFERICGAIGRAFAHDRFRRALKRIRDLFLLREQQRVFTIGDPQAPLNSESPLFIWLNSKEYHGDRDGSATLKSYESFLQNGALEAHFITLLVEKIRGIQELHAVVRLLLGKSPGEVVLPRPSE